MPHHINRLCAYHRSALLSHFLSLDARDRQLRFGTSLADVGIRRYVDALDFIESDVFGVFDDRLRIVGALHVAYVGGEAEMGLSVLRDFRGHGIGNSLFARAAVHLSNRYIHTVYMHCLRENEAVMHLARKNGMQIVVDGAEADARLALPRANPQTVVLEWIADRFAQLDYGRKLRTRLAQRFLEALDSAAASA